MIEEFYRVVPDYPKPGITFIDINALFASPVWYSVVREMADANAQTFKHTTHIVGLESRGFVVGSALAHELGLPFVMMRKPGKLPGDVISESYDLEYGTDTLELQTGILNRMSRVVIADDLFATGGTMSAARTLVEKTGARFLGAQVVVDLSFLHETPGYQLLSYHSIAG
jgi:adenine phosphoribosyltransferase